MMKSKLSLGGLAPSVLVCLLALGTPLGAQSVIPEEIASAKSKSPLGHDIFFQKQGARLTFDLASGITVQINGKFLNIVRVGDNDSGQMIVRTNDKVMSFNYRNGNSGTPEFTGKGNGDKFIRSFYEGLSAGDQDSMEALRSTVTAHTDSFARSLQAQGIQSLSDCDSWTMFSLTAFVSCPATGGLGCLAGAYGLYKQYKTC